MSSFFALLLYVGKKYKGDGGFVKEKRLDEMFGLSFFRKQV